MTVERATLEQRQRIQQRIQLEHELATAFVKWNREMDPAVRNPLWERMFELAAELEKLDEHN